MATPRIKTKPPSARKAVSNALPGRRTPKRVNAKHVAVNPIFSPLAVQSLVNGDNRVLARNIRAEANKGKIKFDIYGFGKFVRQLLEHPLLGSGTLASYDPAEMQRILAGRAFVVEAAANAIFGNTQKARLFANTLLDYLFTKGWYYKERGNEVVENFIRKAGGIKPAKNIVKQYSTNAGTMPLNQFDNKQLNQIGDRKLLGANSDKIIRLKGIMPDRSYVRHELVFSRNEFESAICLLEKELERRG